MGNQIVAKYVSDEELEEDIRKALKIKLNKQKLILQKIDRRFYLIDWMTSEYKKGGWGEYIDFVILNSNENSEMRKRMSNLYLVRTIYFWYSNSIL